MGRSCHPGRPPKTPSSRSGLSLSGRFQSSGPLMTRAALFNWWSLRTYFLFVCFLLLLFFFLTLSWNCDLNRFHKNQNNFSRLSDIKLNIVDIIELHFFFQKTHTHTHFWQPIIIGHQRCKETANWLSRSRAGNLRPWHTFTNVVVKITVISPTGAKVDQFHEGRSEDNKIDLEENTKNGNITTTIYFFYCIY